jgi:nickel-dependent lactate racemase
VYQVEKIANQWLYKDTTSPLEIQVPGEWPVEMVQTRSIAPMETDEQVREAIVHPVAGKRLSELARERESRTACVLVSDATRAVPSARLARYVVEELQTGGVPLEGITFFVAIGVHRPATEEEMKSFAGDLWGKVKVKNHTPFQEDSMVDLGCTSRGTPVLVNREAWECDLHIQIGKVEPHEFAGFSGGRKSVLPGIASEKTIRINHRPEMILHPQAAIGVLAGNPVHEDMVETAQKFRIDFGVNCILNNELQLAAVFAGEMEASHQAAVDYVKQKLSVPVKKPDILVTTPGQPLDIDFYQSVKALIALTEVLDENTVVVLHCTCPEGVSSPDMLRGFRSGDELEKVVQFTTENYQIQMDHVLLLSKILRKRVKIIVCCPHVSDQEIEDMFMIPCRDPDKVMELAQNLTGKAAPSVLFYPRPQTGLPVVQEE